MPEPIILMPQHQNLEPDVLAIGRDLLPAGFRLELASRDDLPKALQDADYLMGFVGRLDDETLLGPNG